ncbi:hypothetical protein REPUB_Repub08aG0002300 [Reevesia pubescens]
MASCPPPAKEFDGMWESLIYESGLKQRLLQYAASALLFTEKGVDPFLVSWNQYDDDAADGVESLAAARKAALSGSEPSDSIRVVNALLTQMDKLKSSPNVIILTTSNITAAIGKPMAHFILDSSESILPDYVTLKEKLNMHEIQEVQTTFHKCKQLLEAAEACEGLSGRSLRKLPFLAHAALNNPYSCDLSKFLYTMIDTAKRECSGLPD